VRARGVAVITGGTKGIGVATAHRLVADGHPVMLTYRRDEQAAHAARRLLEKQGGEVNLVRCDLSEGPAPVLEALASDARTIDILMLNAAASAFKPLAELKQHHVAKTFGITIGAMIELVNAAAPRMTAGGSIISISGGDSMRHIPGHGLLGGAKAALEALTKYYAVELAPRGIRVNCVLPGPVATDSARIWAGEDYESFLRRASAATPAGRIADPGDIAAVIRLLCQPDARWINGQVVVADGGMFFSDRIFTEDA